MQNNQTPKLQPLTTGSGHVSGLFSKLRKLITVLVFIFGFEYFFGHPAIRTTWEGTGVEASSAYRCTMLTLPFLEHHEISGHKTLISTVQPNQTIFQWAVEKGKNLFQK